MDGQVIESWGTATPKRLNDENAVDEDGKTDILVFRYNGSVWQEVGRTLNLSES